MSKEIKYKDVVPNSIVARYKEVRQQYEQEPTTRHALDSYWNQEAYQRGYAEAKLKLKREPLSTKQAEDLWETTFKSAVPYYIFDEICGAIEQYHGIGGEE